MITQAVQDYLKIIFKLANNGKAVSTNAIAERLQISQASVTGMIKKLSDLNWSPTDPTTVLSWPKPAERSLWKSFVIIACLSST